MSVVTRLSLLFILAKDIYLNVFILLPMLIATGPKKGSPQRHILP